MFYSLPAVDIAKPAIILPDRKWKPAAILAAFPVLALPQQPVWNSAASRALSFDGTDDFSGYLFRIRVQSSEFTAGGAYTRLRLTPKTATDNTIISGLFFGKQAGTGNVTDFDGAQAQFFFSGSAGVTLAAGGAPVKTDGRPFVLSPGSNHVISIGLSAVTNKLRFGADGGVWNMYSKSGSAANAGDSVVAAMSADGVNKAIVDLIEVSS